MNCPFVRIFALLSCCTAAAACAGPDRAYLPTPAQPAAAQSSTLVVEPGDAQMARSAHILSYHLMPLRDPGGMDRLGGDRKIVYPADLARHRGPIMKTAVAFNVYVNCGSGGESCWEIPKASKGI